MLYCNLFECSIRLRSAGAAGRHWHAAFNRAVLLYCNLFECSIRLRSARAAGRHWHAAFLRPCYDTGRRLRRLKRTQRERAFAGRGCGPRGSANRCSGSPDIVHNISRPACRKLRTVLPHTTTFQVSQDLPARKLHANGANIEPAGLGGPQLPAAEARSFHSPGTSASCNPR